MTANAQFTGPVTPQSAVEARAAAWLIARLHDKDWDSDRQTQLDTWLAESVAHEVAYLRLEAGWNGADRLVVLRAPLNETWSPGEALSLVKMIYVVGTIFFCVILGALGYVVTQPTDKTFVTPVGGHRMITLADGSKIELNTDTELRLSQGDRRAVLVRGEVYFRIVHNFAHPFSLDAGTHRIVDLGTQFSVRRDADGLQVAVVEGRARVEDASASNSQFAVLSGGDVATTAQGRLVVARRQPDVLEDALSWRRGFVVFHHSTLGAAAGEINRYNTEKIVVVDKGVASRVFGGKFRTDDAERFANVVSTALALQVTRRGSEIIISR